MKRYNLRQGKMQEDRRGLWGRITDHNRIVEVLQADIKRLGALTRACDDCGEHYLPYEVPPRLVPFAQAEGFEHLCHECMLVIADKQIERLQTFRKNLDYLRREEGDSIEITCDNPDWGGPACRVTCYGEWCRDYLGERHLGYDGDTLDDAVQAAVDAKKESEK